MGLLGYSDIYVQLRFRPARSTWSRTFRAVILVCPGSGTFKKRRFTTPHPYQQYEAKQELLELCRYGRYVLVIGTWQSTLITRRGVLWVACTNTQCPHLALLRRGVVVVNPITQSEAARASQSERSNGRLTSGPTRAQANRK